MADRVDYFHPSDAVYMHLSDEELADLLRKSRRTEPTDEDQNIPGYLRARIGADGPEGRVNRWIDYIRARLFWLYSDTPDVVKVRSWFQQHPSQGITPPWYPQDGEGTPWYERYVMFMKFCFDLYRPLDAWETAVTDVRGKHIDRIAKLAEQLAAALTEEVRPHYPGVLAYLPDHGALRLLDMLKPEVIRIMVSGTRFEFDEKEGSVNETDTTAYWRIQDHLDGTFPLSVPGLLRSLAAYAELQRNTYAREKRPNVGNPDVRVFTRHVAGAFKAFYNRQPDEVIAAIVGLAQIDPHYFPDAEQVRSWRGSR